MLFHFYNYSIVTASEGVREAWEQGFNEIVVDHNWQLVSITSLGSVAVEHTSIPQEPVGVAGDGAALIVLDGTWAQARSIFTQNPRLHSVRQVCVFASAHRNMTKCIVSLMISSCSSLPRFSSAPGERVSMSSEHSPQEAASQRWNLWPMLWLGWRRTQTLWR